MEILFITKFGYTFAFFADGSEVGVGIHVSAEWRSEFQVFGWYRCWNRKLIQINTCVSIRYSKNDLDIDKMTIIYSVPFPPESLNSSAPASLAILLCSLRYPVKQIR